ncbi:MAG: nucleotidyltransferase domain-containing protein [Candidatus Taylorbacteria bacterium]|nr:nucleotidyltransferase domain-containing protein [Candidatus Taylorbacteria bacterium]
MIDETIYKKIREIAGTYEFELVALFGSFARGTTRSGSDIDIAVLPKDPSVLSRASEEIGSAFGRNDVEIADLSSPSPYLWHIVAKEGILLFESREGFFSEWKLRSMNLWFDTAPIRLRQKRYLQSWALSQKH